MVYPVFIYPKITAGKRQKMHRLFDSYSGNALSAAERNIKLVKVFSSLEEDGIIIWLLAIMGIKKGFFLDIGSNDCINSNCANLAFNFNWDGVFIDADKKLIGIGKRNYKIFGKAKTQQLAFVNSFVYANNVNELIQPLVGAKEVDFMNIDIDSDDYAVWEALQIVKPKLVVVECKIEFGSYNVVVPATQNFEIHLWGASLIAMNKLAIQKGYTMVAVNRLGFNLFFMRNDIFNSINGLKPLTIDWVLDQPTVRKDFYSNQVMVPLIERVKSQKTSFTV
jgi:hypothetical protein